MTLADRSGLVLASAVPFKGKTSVAQLKYFQNALRSGLFSSGEYNIGRISKKPIMVFGYPIKDSAQEVVAVIGIGLDLEYMRDIFDKANLPAGSSFSLLDHKGTIIYRHLQDSLSEKLIGYHDIREDLFRNMQAGPAEGTFTAVGNDGGLRLYAYKKIGLPDEAKPYLYIRANIPQVAVISKASAAMFRNLLFLTLLFMIGLSLAWLVGKHVIMNRILMLKKALLHMETGAEIIAVSGIVQGGELGELAQSFDNMAAA
ncbi:MAG: cache domain-containing protein, partial [Syntrophales bacterium LBB04]|nr:cache domain-containing protein [Syntrophales bacterium LBB04]